MNMLTNIDPVRAGIMRLEDAQVFDQSAWAQVLIALTDRPNARADAARRMETAKGNQVVHLCTDLGMGGKENELTLVPVAAETEGSYV